jgi:hypothetical protein
VSPPPSADEPISVVVVFEVEPERQVALAKAVGDFAQEVLAPRDGFRSATVHLSLDGTRVINVVEWHRRAAFDAYAAESREEPAARVILEFANPTLMPAVVVARIDGAPRP